MTQAVRTAALPSVDAVADQLRAVLHVSRALTRADDEQELLELIAQATCDCLNFGFCMVTVRADDGDFYARATAGHAAPEQHEEDFDRYVMPAAVYGRLEAVATRLGQVLWVPGDHPVHAEPAVGRAVVRTVPTAPVGQWHPAALLLAPLVAADGRVIGFINPDDPLSGRLPSTGEIAVLEAFAHLAVVALEVVRGRAAERSRLQVADAQRRQLEGLLAAGASVRGHLALGDVLSEIALAMTGAGGFRRAAIYLLDAGTETLRVRATVGLSAADDERLRATPVGLSTYTPLMRPEMRVSRSYLFDHRRFVMPPDLLAHLSVPEDPPDWRDGQWHPLDSLTIPLAADDGTLLGLISVDEPVDSRFPDRSHIQALEFFADQCTVAVTQARRYDELAQLALTDPLTGLPNRRAFTQRARGLLATLRSRGGSAAVLFGDLDNFKSINDECGHPVGDQVLVAVGQLLRERLRASDLVARYGGEEFVALLPDVSSRDARLLAEQLRARVAQLRVAGLPAQRCVRISIGLATADPVAAELGDLLHRADQALYRAKRAGRNQVVVCSD